MPQVSEYYESLTGSERLHESATETFPGGVSHNVRFWEPHPLYIDRAEGPYLWDVDGNRYVDFWMNHMATVLGHSYPDVAEAVAEQARNGLHYGAVNEKALELGREITDCFPSMERLRYCASGTEATMYAVRLARAATGRDVILKARGGWHGGSTDLSKAVHAPWDEPTTQGLPGNVAETVEPFDVNDEGGVTDLLDAHEGDVAGLIIEPMLLAGGGVEATDEFLAFLEAEGEEREFVLIFDEVVTGLRVSPGSYQARVGVEPDLTTFGKAFGGGLPIGGLGGRADLFENARPDVDVPPEDEVLAGGGTFTVNPMTATAGLATLEVMDDEPVYDHTESLAERVRGELVALFDEVGVDAAVLGTSSMFLPHFEPDRPLDSVDAVETGTNREALLEYQLRLFDHGFYFKPRSMGAVSYGTTDEHLDAYVEASRTVLTEMQEDGLL